MDEIHKQQYPISSHPSQSSVFRSCSSSLPKHNVLIIKNQKQIFPSDFFSLLDKKDQLIQFKSQPNQPLLPTSICCVTSNDHPNTKTNCQSKIIVDIQKEIDEDKELLDMLKGKDLPRHNSENHYNKPHSIREKTTGVKSRKCEIIPEVDEDKLKTLSLISHSLTSNLNKDEKEDINDYDNDTNNNNNRNNSKYNNLYKKRKLMLSERNNESSSDSIKKIKNILKRFHCKEATKGICELNKLILPILSNANKKLVNIKKANEISKKSIKYNSQEGINGEKEVVKTKNGKKPTMISEGKSIYSQETMNRAKVSSAPNHISKYSAQQLSSSKENINKTNDYDIENYAYLKERKYQQFEKKNIILHRYNSNNHLSDILSNNNKRQFNKYIQIESKNHTPYNRNQKGLFMSINPQYLLEDHHSKEKTHI